jgi:hypothetical protein
MLTRLLIQDIKLKIICEIAQNQQSELLIHGENGRIREKNSYGNDPYPPKG